MTTPEGQSSGMVVDVEVGEGFTVTIPTPDSPGRNVTVTLLYKAGRRARLRVATDDDVAIARTHMQCAPC